MKYIFIALLLLSTQADAAGRRLSECGAFSGTPTEAVPFDLDLCALKEGDDVTQLLLDIRTRWPGGFYVRAPSQSLTVISNTIKWPTGTKYYVFLEDQDPANKLLIQHAKEPSDFWTMWWFENFHTVKLGGPNLALTFRGNHPGLANCDVQKPLMLAAGWPESQAANCDANRGLLDFRIADGTSGEVADVRANIHYSQQFSIYTWGSAAQGATSNKIRQFNVSGTHFATSGVFFHQGVKHAWSDPDRFKVTDPYVRGYGWTGTVGVQTDSGLPVGCPDRNKDQVRFAGFGGYYTDSIAGGMTVEYGAFNWVQRFTGRVGNGINDPYVVKIKDWGISGPGTPYPAGVRVKKTAEANFFKGDPHSVGTAGTVQRHVRLVRLTDTYGSGPSAASGTGCADTFGDGVSNFFRFENSTNLPNRDWHVTFAGDWRSTSQGGTFSRGELLYFAWDASESYGHTVRVDKDTTIADTLTLHDRNTLTGPGTFANIATAKYSDSTLGRGNNVVDTNLTGTISIGAGTETTTINNVNFVGSAREIIKIGAGSTALVSKLCAPAGSTISGTGALRYNGAVVALPFRIESANSCVIAEAPVPSPPVDVTVN